LQDTLPHRQRDGIAVRHRVLLVDDDAISMEILAMLLGGDGHEVLQAVNGEAALNLLSGSGAIRVPDVLLVDMQMPGISGWELAERVQAMQIPPPRLLAMSATVTSNWRVQGFDDFLLKPLEIEDLRRALDSAPNPKEQHPSQWAAQQTRRSNRVPASEAHIDQAVVNKLAGAMPPKALYELYHACIADTRTRITGLQGRVLTGQMDEVRRSAHQVKGAASMIGAVRIAKLATSIESGSCKEEDTLPLLSDLLDACEHLEGILLAGKLQKSNDDNTR
jgi:CheY-like chemotaxis protein